MSELVLTGLRGIEESEGVLKANNDQAMFNIVACFEGDTAKTATAYMTTPNGTQCAACTTTQYNSLKPSTNSTAITVRAQTTEGATTLMNMEGMRCGYIVL
jgi:hypothetical protein